MVSMTRSLKAHMCTYECCYLDKRNRPNVRTLNTLLRGCLWTAATADESEQVAGGVVTSEASWELFRSCVSSDDLDCSSYEYFIAQLCYALRVEEAESVIGEMKRKHSLANRLDEADPSAVESLAVSLVALARAMALLTQFDEGAAVARNALQTAETAKHLLQDKNESSVQTTGSTGGKKHESFCFYSLIVYDANMVRCCVRSKGKRGWKEDSSSAPRRAVSNSLFRSHRLSEVQSEASDLLSVCSLHQEDAKGTDLAFYLVTRLLYFSGGGTTDLSARVHDKTTAGGSEEIASVRGQLMNSLWHTFGLRSAIRQLSPDSDWHSSIRVFGARDCLRVQEAVGLPASIISEDGFIDFREVFRQHQDTSPDRSDQPTSQATEARPLDIELGSGFGDWIVYQAISNPQRDYVAVELRADRVAQTFSKTLLNGSSSPLSNLCCVGSDCGSFLRERVRQGSVATVFVNHPEPPTQTYGANSHVLTEIAEGGNEPAHMLSSDTLISASKCLQSNGRLIVVTDNRFYARLLCVTLVKSMKAFTGSICSTDLARCPGIRQIESFGAGRERVDLYEGQPSEAIGHTVQSGRNSGTSYFDRLWRSGAGTHAERRKRFIISMERAHGASKPSSAKNRQVYRSKEARAGNAGKSGNTSKKNRKKSEAKQKRRNERRLAKRAAGEGGTAASLFSADSLFRCGL